jgi:hypothetical protein
MVSLQAEYSISGRPDKQSVVIFRNRLLDREGHSSGKEPSRECSCWHNEKSCCIAFWKKVFKAGDI